MAPLSVGPGGGGGRGGRSVYTDAIRDGGRNCGMAPKTDDIDALDAPDAVRTPGGVAAGPKTRIRPTVRRRTRGLRGAAIAFPDFPAAQGDIASSRLVIFRRSNYRADDKYGIQDLESLTFSPKTA